jgi:hypothetical protein
MLLTCQQQPGVHLVGLNIHVCVCIAVPRSHPGSVRHPCSQSTPSRARCSTTPPSQSTAPAPSWPAPSATPRATRHSSADLRRLQERVPHLLRAAAAGASLDGPPVVVPRLPSVRRHR